MESSQLWLILVFLPIISCDFLFKDFDFGFEEQFRDLDRRPTPAETYEKCRNLHNVHSDLAPEDPELFDVSSVRPSDVAQSAVAHQSRKWPGGVIPLKLQKNLNKQQIARFACAAHYFEAHTCIKFIPWNSSHIDYVYVTKNDARKGCFSEYIGRRGRRQIVNLDATDPHCWETGTIIHELMHVIGFFHEQARNDRDEHIVVHWDHIPDQYEYQFKTAEQLEIKQKLVGQYDYGSIMHYKRFMWGLRRPTMTAKRPFDVQFKFHNLMGNRDNPTEMDRTKINLLYCSDPEDCVVSGWLIESVCSATCGSGTQVIRRQIVHQGSDKGKPCPELSKTMECNTQSCPIDCEVGQWQNNGQCSASCGGGIQKLKRKVVKEDRHGGARCPDLESNVSCNKQDCVQDCIVEVLTTTPCSVTCGKGSMFLLRRVVQHPSPGGKPCPDELSLVLPCERSPCLTPEYLANLQLCSSAKVVPTDPTFMESYFTPEVDEAHPWNSRRCDCVNDYAKKTIWFKLAGTGGNRIIAHKPYEACRCGASWPGYIDGEYPKDVHELVTVDLCYRSPKQICSGRAKLDVMKCGDHDFMYRFHECSHGCYLAFCTEYYSKEAESERACNLARMVQTSEKFTEFYITPKVDDGHPYSSRRCDCKEDYVTMGDWVKLYGSGGNRIVNHEVSTHDRCWASWPGWIKGDYPTDLHEMVTVDLCYRSDNDSCQEKRSLDIMKCGIDDFAFRFHPCNVGCFLAYCTEGDRLSGPAEWTMYQPTSKLYRFFPISVNFSEAKEHCRSYGATLVSIRNELENEFVIKTLANESEFFYLGAQKSGDSFQWIDNSDWIYDNWADTEPNDGYGNEHCVAKKRGHRLLTWVDLTCDLKLQFVCQIEMEPMESDEITSNWTYFQFTIDRHRSFFRLFLEKKSWQDAQNQCETFGANLVSLHRPEEKDFVARLAARATNPKKKIWIGGRIKEGTREFVWQDSTQFVYENWNINEPNNNHGNEKCIQMKIKDENRWHDKRCDRKYRFVCRLGP